MSNICWAFAKLNSKVEAGGTLFKAVAGEHRQIVRVSAGSGNVQAIR